MLTVAAYQAPLLPSGAPEAIDLIARQVRTCESLGVQVLCCPEAILGGLADYAVRPDAIAIDVKRGQLRRVVAPIASDTVTTIVGFTEVDEVTSTTPRPSFTVGHRQSRWKSSAHREAIRRGSDRGRH